MRDNRHQIVGVSVQGQVSCPEFPTLPASPYTIGADGTPQLLLSAGGIVYNVRVGDSAYGWLADSVQPGVSVKSPDFAANQALNTFACIGNEAIVVSGRATGERGTVVGKSGRFAEHVICHFADGVLEELAVEDKVLVRAYGRSLTLLDQPEIQLKSISPALLDALEVESAGGNGISVPVVAEFPAFLAGAGAGLLAESGSLQIQSDDEQALREHRLHELRLGDVVAVRDLDSRWGNGYRQGAMAIGVVAHGDSPRAGAGPGITIVITAIGNQIRPTIVAERNLATMLDLASPARIGAQALDVG